MNKVKWEDLVVGMQVVMNSGDDAIVYTIKEINGLNVKVMYQSHSGGGEWIIGGPRNGWIHYSVCQYPNTKKLGRSAAPGG